MSYFENLNGDWYEIHFLMISTNEIKLKLKRKLYTCPYCNNNNYKTNKTRQEHIKKKHLEIYNRIKRSKMKRTNPTVENLAKKSIDEISKMPINTTYDEKLLIHKDIVKGVGLDDLSNAKQLLSDIETDNTLKETQLVNKIQGKKDEIIFELQPIYSSCLETFQTTDARIIRNFDVLADQIKNFCAVKLHQIDPKVKVVPELINFYSNSIQEVKKKQQETLLFAPAVSTTAAPATSSTAAPAAPAANRGMFGFGL